MSPASVVANKKTLPSLECLVCSQLHTMETLTEGDATELRRRPRRRISAYTIAHRCGWKDGAVEEFLWERKAATLKMLRDLGRELECQSKILRTA